MRWPFARKPEPALPAAQPAVGRILVRQSAYMSEDPQRLVAEVVDFVNDLMNYGLYLRDEIPVTALRSYHADYYLTQVANGGHGQFVRNSGWRGVVVRDVREGLRAMGAGAFIAIFDDLRRLIERNPQRSAAITQESRLRELDPAMAELDKRFHAHEPFATLLPAHARWLQGVPEVEVVADSRYRHAMQTLCKANPDRPARLRDRRRETIEAALVDPLKVTARLLCAAAGALPVRAIGASDPTCRAPDGRTGTGWHVHTADGRQMLMLFEDVVYLCDTYLADGRRLTDDLLQEQSRRLEAGDFDGLEIFANQQQAEIACLPTAHVADAIRAARRMPVLTFAELLCGKLSTGETVRELYAAARLDNGQFIWFLQTEQRMTQFSFTGDRLVLIEAGTNTRLASLSAREMRAAAPTAEPFGAPRA